MLVEREDSLAALATAMDAALAGRGELVFVGGEAGVGKSSLAAAAVQRAGEAMRVRHGTADNVTTAAALGPLVDALPELSAAIDAAAEGSRLKLFRVLREALAVEPTLLLLEDVHWADEATLDLIKFLGRRLDRLPLLVIATYRTEALSLGDPLVAVLGDLASTRGVSRLGVAPLSVAAVAALVAAAGSPLDPAELHERTGGNAFYVTEVLAGDDDAVPDSVRDAVLARVNRLSDGARHVLGAAAILGQASDAPLLGEVSGRTIEAVDECVRHGLLVAAPDGWTFRHELAREVIEATLPPSELQILHAHARAALVARNSGDDRRLAHHAAEAGHRLAACEHARRAAVRAARLSAHREAAAQYRLALRCFDGDAATRGEMLAALSYECYLTDDLAGALAARLIAMELAELSDDPQVLGRHQRWASRLSWFLGRNADSERYADRAIATLQRGGDGHELAMAYSNRAQLCMLAGDAAGTDTWGREAIGMAQRLGDREVEIHALNNVGTMLAERGELLDGSTMVRRSLDLALADDAHEHVARAYTNLGSSGVLNRRFADAERDLRTGIAYCIDHDVDAWRLYMNAQLAQSLDEQGRYDEARSVAEIVLRQQRVSPISVILASVVVARIAIRRGEPDGELLERAWQLAVETGEAQRIVPVASAIAERAWIAGETTTAHSVLEAAWGVVHNHAIGWRVAEIAYWRSTAGLSTDTATRLPEPFALMLDHRWRAAADAWAALGCPLWQATALARDPSLSAARAALDIVDGLGAAAVRRALLRTRHTASLPVPRRPRADTRDNPAELTARELEVLGLLAEGMSDAELADRLFLSKKTIGHHVSAVLRKLAQPTRAHAVAAAVSAGLIDSPRNVPVPPR